MTEAPIPFGNREASGQAELAGASPISFNVLTDAAGAVHRRPGLAARSGFISTSIDSDGIIGVYVTADGSCYAVSGGWLRSIYKVSAGATNLSLVGGYSLLEGTERPMFAETEALLVVASGLQMQKVILSSGASSRLKDTASPSDHPKATHVVAHSSRLVANDSDYPGFVRFSDQAAGSSYAGHEYWLLAGIGTSGYVSADARPDPILAIWDNTNEVFVFQSRTLQVFNPDAIAGYAPVATRQVGCGAAYSVIPFDQAFCWMDDQRRFVLSDGRSFQVLSDPIAQTLRDLTTVSDCFGYRFNEGYADVMVWTFPTEGLTFAYQQGVGWSRWAGWDGNWSAFPVTAHQTTTESNIVGLSDGRIAELKNSNLTDYDDPIRAYVESGFQNHGTSARKKCQSVRITLKRGKTSGSTAPVGWLGWRDRPGVTSGRIPVSLGASGDTEAVVPFYSLGMPYRTRSWFFEFSGTDELVLANAIENFQVLGD